MDEYVGIIVLNYINYNDTIECIKSLILQDYKNFRIVLVDNNSPNDSVMKLQDFFIDNRISFCLLNDSETVHKSNISLVKGQVTLISSRENRGYAAGNNIGIRYALKDSQIKLFWVINNDTIAKGNTLSTMVYNYNRDKYSRPIGNVIYNYYGNKDLQTYGGFKISMPIFTPKISIDSDIDYLSGASYLIDRKFINNYGLMTEDFFLNSEDLDYFYSYKQKFKTKNSKALPFVIVGEIYHKESASQGLRSARACYYYTRNMLYTCKKYKKAVLPILQLYTLMKILLWRFKNIEISKSMLLGYKDYGKNVLGKVDYFDK